MRTFLKAAVLALFAQIACSGAIAQSLVNEETIEGKVYEVEKTQINATPEIIFSVLTDYKQAKKLFANLKSCQVLDSHECKGATVRDVAFSLSGIAKILNFSYVLTLKETFPNEIEWHRLSGAFKSNDGFWKIEAAPDGASMVTFAKSIDGGILPQSFVNSELQETMPRVMSNLKLLAEAHQDKKITGD